MSAYVLGSVFKHSRAKDTALLVLLAIADIAGDEGVALPKWDTSVATLARKARVSERTCQRAIRELEALGELVVEDGNGKHANTYQVLLDRNHQLFEGPAQALTPRQGKPTTAEQKKAQAERLKKLRESVDNPRKDPPVGGDTSDTPGVTPDVKRGDTAMSPNPSIRLSVKSSLGGETEKPARPKAVDKSTAAERQAAWLEAGLSEEIRAWARAHGVDGYLDLHLGFFRDYLAANPGYAQKHRDLDACFRNCVRADWGNVRKNAQIAAAHGRGPDLNSWWTTSDGVKAKGYALGIKRGESEPYIAFEARVLSAACDRDGWGAWVDPERLSSNFNRCVAYRRSKGLPVPERETA